jgi:hypothetical protein
MVDTGGIGGGPLYHEKVPEIAHATSDDGGSIRAFSFSSGTQLVTLKKRPYFRAKICRSKRPPFTKLIFWVKIVTIWGG